MCQTGVCQCQTAAGNSGASLQAVIHKVNCLHERGHLNSRQRYELTQSLRQVTDLSVPHHQLEEILKPYGEAIRQEFVVFLGPNLAQAQA